MPLSRRLFLSGAAAGVAFAGLARRSGAQEPARPYRNEVHGYGELVPDPNGVFDLPEGFSYDVVSQAGETMSDGFLVPFKADGMGCFQFEPDRVVLVRNHELHHARDGNHGPFGVKRRLVSRYQGPAYDRRGGAPLPGGTTTLVYDYKARRLVSQNLSLAGTTTNCAGGTTPWGTWLSCEERMTRAGQDGVGEDHGWVFETPAAAGRLSDAVPLKGLGRFMHEAAAVDPRTGIVYLTEDRNPGGSLFYRFLPDAPGNLARGGRLQALGFRDAPRGGDSRNYDGRIVWRPGDWKQAVWVDLDGTDNPDEDLHERGHAAGAAWFARGEGIHFGQGELYFTCTSGGPAKIGQIMRYVPSRFEGRAEERDEPARIQLFLESTDPKRLDYADNIAVAPWGHLFTCEDKYVERPVNHLKGITPDGKVYTLGRNAFREQSELAGVCFSPDGSVMFLNIYWPGITLAITGPWDRFRA